VHGGSYGIFGIDVGQKTDAEWLLHQVRATFRSFQKRISIPKMLECRAKMMEEPKLLPHAPYWNPHFNSEQNFPTPGGSE